MELEASHNIGYVWQGAADFLLHNFAVYGLVVGALR